jgi:hypothetical protein
VRLVWGAGFEKEPVLTRQSLALDILSTNASARVSWRAVDRVTVSGLAQYRDYSDGNSATFASVLARWDFFSRHPHRVALLFGLDLLSADEDLDNGYYDPEHYAEFGPGAEWVMELPSRATVGLRLRTGLQDEKDADSEVFYAATAFAGIPLGRALRLSVEVGSSNSSLSSASGFEQTRGAVYLTWAF